MSGPNTQYDPVEVAALDPAALDAAVREATAAFAAATTLDELKAARIAHVDRGAVALAKREIGALPPERQGGGRQAGGRGRRPRSAVRTRAARPSSRTSATGGSSSRRRVDVTRPVYRRPPGARHPLELTQERLMDAFVGMGWEVVEGPEVESEWMNFDALNLGKDHPARQMQDTFFVDPADGGLVLRTQTSPVQIRTMLERTPPIYVVSPGKVFRTDDLDATHTPVFHQIEALAVDKGLTMAHLRGAHRPLRQRDVRRGHADPGARVVLPVHRAEHGDRLRLLRLPRRQPGRAGPVAARGGSSSAARAWSTARCCAPAASTRTSTPGSRSGWASSGRCSCATACTDMHDIVEGDVRFSEQFGMEV